MLFPAEAKVAMKIAHADAASEYGGLREVDLNETPTVQHKRLRSRMDSLQKTGSGLNFVVSVTKVLWELTSVLQEAYICTGQQFMLKY